MFLPLYYLLGRQRQSIAYAATKDKTFPDLLLKQESYGRLWGDRYDEVHDDQSYSTVLHLDRLLAGSWPPLLIRNSRTKFSLRGCTRLNIIIHHEAVSNAICESWRWATSTFIEAAEYLRPLERDSHQVVAVRASEVHCRRQCALGK